MVFAKDCFGLGIQPDMGISPKNVRQLSVRLKVIGRVILLTQSLAERKA